MIFKITAIKIYPPPRITKIHPKELPPRDSANRRIPKTKTKNKTNASNEKTMVKIFLALAEKVWLGTKTSDSIINPSAIASKTTSTKTSMIKSKKSPPFFGGIIA